MTDATRCGMEIDAQLDHASPLALWLDTPARPAPRPPLDGDVETDLVVIGGGFTGLWTALRAKERDPDRQVLLLEADRLADHATGRNGGFCEASLTHGEANGRDAVARRVRRCSIGSAGRTSSRSRRPSSATASTATSAAPARWRVATRAARGRRPRAGRAAASSTRPPCARAGRLARRTSPAGWTADGCALVDPARLAWGLADAAEPLGVRIAEHTRVEDVAARRRQVHGAARRSGTVTRPTGRAGHQRVPPAAARGLRVHTVPVYDYVLATEPLTADAAGVDRLARPDGHRRLRQPVPLLPAHRRRPDPLGRLRRDLPLRPPHRAAATTTGRRPTRLLARALLRDVPAARAACASRTAGAASSTPAPGSAPFFGRRSAAGSRTPLGFTGPRRRRLPVRRRRDARPARRRPDRADPAADGPDASRCRSRPSPSPTSASSSPAGRWRGPTAPAGATSGCGRSTASASASTAERRRAQELRTAVGSPAKFRDRRPYRASTPSGWVSSISWLMTCLMRV